MALKQITRVNIAEKVFEQLRDQILQGTWKEGEKLPSEQELTETLGVSRSSVRQAIRTLADYGMVETRNGTGTYVKRQISGNYMLNIVPIGDLQFEDIVEVLDFLCLIEDSVAAMAVQRCTQEELAEALRKRGIAVTQATVSRDIKELRLLKVLSPHGVYKYATADKAEHGLSDRRIRMLTDSVLSISSANNLIVVKTLSGSANVAGEALDSMHWPEVLGTLAGDNTILMIIRSNEEVPVIISRIQDLMK